jgi:hypothetical protein
MNLARAAASAVVAASLVAAPIVAQAAPAERVASDVSGENLRGGFIIPLLGLIAVVLGVLVLMDDDDTIPASP